MTNFSSKKNEQRTKKLVKNDQEKKQANKQKRQFWKNCVQNRWFLETINFQKVSYQCSLCMKTKQKSRQNDGVTMKYNGKELIKDISVANNKKNQFFHTHQPREGIFDIFSNCCCIFTILCKSFKQLRVHQFWEFLWLR